MNNKKVNCSTGLFNRAILLSGSILSQGFLKPHSQNWPLRLARKIGYTGSDEDRDVLEYLQAADPVSMAEEQNKILSPDERELIMFPFLPHIEPYVTKDTFMSKSPIELCRTAWGNDIDILIGGTSHEGGVYLAFIAKDPSILTNINLDSAIPNDLNFTDEATRADFVERIRKIYYGPNDPTKDKMAFCEVNLLKDLFVFL